jgi:hypothetical protein
VRTKRRKIRWLEASLTTSRQRAILGSVRKAGVLGGEPKRFARACPSANVAISAALAVLLASCGGTGTAAPTLAQVRKAAMTWYRLSEPSGIQVDSATCSATSHRFKGRPEFACQEAETPKGLLLVRMFVMEANGRLARVSMGGDSGARPTDPAAAANLFPQTLRDPSQATSVSCVRNEPTPYGTISGPGLFQCKATFFGNEITVVVDWNADGTLAEDKIEDIQQAASSQPTSGATLSDSSTCADWNSASTSDKETYGATLQPPSAMSPSAFLGLLNTECQGFAADPSLAGSTTLAAMVEHLGGLTDASPSSASPSASNTTQSPTSGIHCTGPGGGFPCYDSNGNPIPDGPETTPLATTAPDRACGEISTPAPGTSSGTQTVAVDARGAVSCTTARSVISDELSGKGAFHAGPDMAQSYSLVDGWKCTFGPPGGGCLSGGGYVGWAGR